MIKSNSSGENQSNTIIDNRDTSTIRSEDGSSRLEQDSLAQQSESNPQDSPDTTHACGEILDGRAIVKTIEAEKVELFLDEYGDAHVWSPVLLPNPHYETIRIGSSRFKAVLLEILEKTSKSIPNPRELKNAIAIMKLMAIRNGERKLSNRFVSSSSAIHIDVGDKNWNSVCITETGWELKPQKPIFFRPVHLRELPHPERGGDIWKLFDFLPVEDQQTRLLLIAWIVSTFFTDRSTPILSIVGPQGSGKSTFCRFIKFLVDPSLIPLLGNVQQKDMDQVLHNYAVICLENVHHFKREFSDDLVSCCYRCWW